MDVRELLAEATWKIVLRVARIKVLSGIAIPTLISVGLAMIYGEDFAFASITLLVAAIWGIAFWHESTTLNKRKPKTKPRPRKSGYDYHLAEYERRIREFLIWKWGGTATILCLLALSAMFVGYKREQLILKRLKGNLIPASDSTPENKCGEIPKEDVILYLGDNQVVAHVFPHRVLAISDLGPVITLDRDDRGLIAIMMDVRSRDGRIVAQLNREGFAINQNNYLEMKRGVSTPLCKRPGFVFGMGLPTICQAVWKGSVPFS